MRYEGLFNLVVQGQMGLWLLPLLMERLGRTAPHIRLNALTRVDRAFEQLNNGKLDFILQAELREYPPDLRLTSLGFASPVLLARKGHPLVNREFTWDEALRYPHIQLVIDELANIHFVTGANSTFLEHMAKAVPELRTDQLLVAIQVVRHTDCLFPAPPLFMEPADISQELIALPLPDDEQVTLKYVMVNHQRVNNSAPHQFLYGEMLQVIDCFRTKYKLPTLAELRVQRQLEY